MKHVPSLYIAVGIGFLVMALVLYQFSKSYSGAKASSSAVPRNVRVSNVSDTAFTVSWVTPDKAATGEVSYGTDGTFLTAFDDRESANNEIGRFTHHVTVKKLVPDTQYTFYILSQGAKYDNDGKPYQQKTAVTTESTPPLPDTVFGTVKKQSEVVSDAIIYVSIGKNSLLSSYVGKNGNWLITLSNMRTEDFSKYASYTEDDTMKAEVTAGALEYTTQTATVGKREQFRSISLTNGTAGGEGVALPKGISVKISVRIQGMTQKPKVGKEMLLKVIVSEGSLQSAVSQTVPFTVSDTGVWTGTATFDTVAPGNNYKLGIKGPLHGTRTICDLHPEDKADALYKCASNALTLAAANTFDFSGISLYPGDTNGDNVINTQDVTKIIKNLSSTDPEILNQADFNADGIINTQDYGLIIESMTKGN